MFSSRGVTQHTKHSKLLSQTAANIRLSDPKAVVFLSLAGQNVMTTQATLLLLFIQSCVDLTDSTESENKGT